MRLATYLLDHSVDEPLFYMAYPELSLGRIERNSRCCRAIRELVSDPQRTELYSLRRKLANIPPAEREDEAGMLRAKFFELVRNHLEVGQIAGPRAPQPRPAPPQEWKASLGLPVFAFTVVAHLLEGLGARVGRGGGGRPSKSGPSAREEARARHLARLLQQEDTKVQNQLTHLTDIKRPYFLRVPLLRLVFWGWTREAKYRFNQGSLGGIDGIHFARWVILEERVHEGPRDKGTRCGPLRSRKRYRLLFLSNYDGSWEGYLGNFVDRASIGLTTIWCNTRDFPRSRIRWRSPKSTPGSITRNFPRSRNQPRIRWRFPLFLELGAQREEAFKQWVRKHQLRTQTWYSAHEDRSVNNIFNDRDVCSEPTTPAELKQWVRRIM